MKFNGMEMKRSMTMWRHGVAPLIGVDTKSQSHEVTKFCFAFDGDLGVRYDCVCVCTCVPCAVFG